MRTSGVAGALCAAFIVLTLIVPAVAAQGGEAETLEYYPTPATPQAEDVRDLFNIILGIGLAVFVFVEALLIYVLWRFRKNRQVPVGETHRGHTRAEIAWTAVPAIILVFVGAMSAQTMDTLDTLPEDPDFHIGVEAFQFGWQFHYPNASMQPSFGTLYVEEGSTVQLNITSNDVIHAVWIPEFAIKIDAVPGRVNHQWFTAPEVGSEPQSYFLQCAEYCGVGHHDMRGEIVVFPEGQGPDGQAFGEPQAPATGGGGNVDAGNATVLNVVAYDEGSNYWFEVEGYDGRNPTIELTPGQTYTVNLSAPESNAAPHNFHVGGSVDQASDYVMPGDSTTFTFAVPEGEVPDQYWCDPHKGSGMVGDFTEA